MEALRQSVLRSHLAKPLAGETQPKCGAHAATAAIEARFSALDRKLDTLIEMLKTPDGEQDGPQYLLTSDIRRVVTLYFNVSEQEMDRGGRSPKITRIRHIAFYLCRTHTTRSLSDIGRVFGGREHSTVVHGIRKIGAQRETDAELDRDLSRLEARLADLLAQRNAA